uniref:Uncharacterized protein n=1 Tax=Anopheles coluzzii TaxID=1518534 RepID=A0A8W7PG10_ANOCL
MLLRSHHPVLHRYELEHLLRVVRGHADVLRFLRGTHVVVAALHQPHDRFLRLADVDFLLDQHVAAAAAPVRLHLGGVLAVDVALLRDRVGQLGRLGQIFGPRCRLELDLHQGGVTMREKKGGALQKIKKRLSHSFGRLCK